MNEKTQGFAAKPRFALLDGLRGVAALMVIWYHIFEGFATSPLDQKFNHGYLAVDFFFILSGFVIGYAYDDRWGKMTTGQFFKRRLIRLHPLVILGALLGTAAFLIQGGVQWDGTEVATWRILVSLLLGMRLLPCFPGGSGEVRGNGEMFPLHGPSWSLFFEYIGNIMYAFLLRRLPTRWLRTFVAASGLAYASYAVLNGSGVYHMGVGWTMADHNFIGGFLRVSFSFSAGLLMSRGFSPIKIKGAFWICSAMIAGLLSVPYLGSEANWINGFYDCICTLLLFPMIIYIGASGEITDKCSERICSFLGETSYPLYIIHYPIMYLFYAWLWKNGLSFSQTWPVALAIFIGTPMLAYACFKLYDEPVRRWISRHL